MWEIEGKECLICLAARPAYCDRGNHIATINTAGELAEDFDAAEAWPRYYFDEYHARQEIVAWLHKREQYDDALSQWAWRESTDGSGWQKWLERMHSRGVSPRPVVKLSDLDMSGKIALLTVAAGEVVRVLPRGSIFILLASDRRAPKQEFVSNADPVLIPAALRTMADALEGKEAKE